MRDLTLYCINIYPTFNARLLSSLPFVILHMLKSILDTNANLHVLTILQEMNAVPYSPLLLTSRGSLALELRNIRGSFFLFSVPRTLVTQSLLTLLIFLGFPASMLPRIFWWIAFLVSAFGPLFVFWGKVCLGAKGCGVFHFRLHDVGSWGFVWFWLERQW